jgi:hypothetical protein
MPARPRIVPPAQDRKVFWFFSSEKNVFLSDKRRVCRQVAAMA